MDDLGANAPEQIEDDLLYERLFSDHGEQKKMARYKGVSRATEQRQVKAADANHPTDYHRGRRTAYAAGYRQDDKGRVLKAGLDAAYLAGVSDRKGATGGRVEFPAPLAHRVIEVELNPPTAAATPVPRRVADIDRLIEELTAYKEQICSRDEEGQVREDRETQSPPPLQVAART